MRFALLWALLLQGACACSSPSVWSSTPPPQGADVQYTRAVSFEIESSRTRLSNISTRALLRSSPHATSLWYRRSACAAGTLMSIDTQTYWRFAGVVTSPTDGLYAFSLPFSLNVGEKVCLYLFSHSLAAHIVRYSGRTFTQGSVFLRTTDVVARWGNPYYVNSLWNPAAVSPVVTQSLGDARFPVVDFTYVTGCMLRPPVAPALVSSVTTRAGTCQYVPQSGCVLLDCAPLEASLTAVVCDLQGDADTR